MEDSVNSRLPIKVLSTLSIAKAKAYNTCRAPQVTYRDFRGAGHVTGQASDQQKQLVGSIQKCVFVRDARLFMPREFYDILYDLLYFSVCFIGDSIVPFQFLVLIVCFIVLCFFICTQCR